MERSGDRHLLCEVSKRGVATLTLNRPDKHNAFDSDLIRMMTEALKRLAHDASVRCLILRANGKHFSAGADLNWMRSMASKIHEENLKDANELAELMSALDSFPRPVIALVHGAVYGGGVGLIACCDIVLAVPDTRFCLSEVKVGLVPATIAPYVCRAIGVRQARRYMLTAEVINASESVTLGLVHILLPGKGSKEQRTGDESVLTHITEGILSNSPDAMKAVKALCSQCHNKEINAELISYTSSLIADLRVSPQGQEGLNAFLEKRRPDWEIK